MKADLKRAARIGGITALSAAAASATAFATTKFLMRTALNRDMPKVAEKAGDAVQQNSSNKTASSIFRRKKRISRPPFTKK